MSAGNLTALFLKDGPGADIPAGPFVLQTKPGDLVELLLCSPNSHWWLCRNPMSLETGYLPAHLLTLIAPTVLSPPPGSLPDPADLVPLASPRNSRPRRSVVLKTIESAPTPRTASAESDFDDEIRSVSSTRSRGMAKFHKRPGVKDKFTPAEGFKETASEVGSEIDVDERKFSDSSSIGSARSTILSMLGLEVDTTSGPSESGFSSLDVLSPENTASSRRKGKGKHRRASLGSVVFLDQEVEVEVLQKQDSEDDDIENREEVSCSVITSDSPAIKAAEAKKPWEMPGFEFKEEVPGKGIKRKKSRVKLKDVETLFQLAKAGRLSIVIV